MVGLDSLKVLWYSRARKEGMERGTVLIVTSLLAVMKSITNLQKEVSTGMATIQEQLDGIVSQISAGIDELYAEINRLATENPNVDFSQAQALADKLNTDAFGNRGGDTVDPNAPQVNPL